MTRVSQQYRLRNTFFALLLDQNSKGHGKWIKLCLRYFRFILLSSGPALLLLYQLRDIHIHTWTIFFQVPWRRMVDRIKSWKGTYMYITVTVFILICIYFLWRQEPLTSACSNGEIWITNKWNQWLVKSRSCSALTSKC